MLDGIRYDLRFAFQRLRRDRGFTVASIAMLALALALNATVFTVVQAMLFRGLPLATRSDRLVYMYVRRPSGPTTVWYADFEAWQAAAPSFAGLAFSTAGPIAFRDGDGHPIDMRLQRVTVNTFGVAGVRPLLGRDFSAADERPGAPAVAILSYRFWESRFGKRADAVGSTVHVDGQPTTIVGVMPEGFTLVYEQNLWMPLIDGPERHQKGFAGGVFGRLRDGATLQGAQAEIDTINRRLAAADPETDRRVAASVLDYSGHIGPDARMIYGSLWAGAWFVLLIACANLANLTLVRTTARSRELSTRMALGASRWRMIRQMLAENLVLAGMAGAAAWWITSRSVDAWAKATASRYVALDYRVDSGTLAYLAAVSVAAALLCALAPAARVAQLAAHGALNSDARGATHGGHNKRVAAGLVAGQMALAIVLLCGAGVLVRSLAHIVGAETGVRDPERILVAAMQVPSDLYNDPATRLAYFDRLEAALMHVPGIEQATVCSAVPANGGSLRTFEIEGRPNPPDNDPSVQFLTVDAGYFPLLRAPIVSGRDFDRADRSSNPLVAIVNRRFAETVWPGEEPVGKRLRSTAGGGAAEWRTVVGVVENIMQGDPLRQHFKPLVYIPFRQDPLARGRDSTGSGFNGANVLIRTSAPAAVAAPAVQSAAQKVDADVVVHELATLRARFGFNRDIMDLEHAELGKHAAVAPIFAAIALLLAASGLAAVVAHSVARRTKEIGIRMAIGAAAKDVGAMILREGMRPVGIGVLLGLAASLAVNRILRSQLVGVSPYDPATLVAAPLVLTAVALIACHLPARRAMRVDPAVALRHE